MQKDYFWKAKGVLLEGKRSTVGRQMEYSWRAKVVHFKQKGRFLRGDKLHTSTTKAYNQLNINNISLHAQNSRISSLKISLCVQLAVLSD